MTDKNNPNPPNKSYHHADPVAFEILTDWYFSPLLAWQQDTWQYFVKHYRHDNPTLPHAILIAGNAGTGKRAFVYRFVAWAFCQSSEKQQTQTACGQCESCQWLKAGTHPNLYQIPTIIKDEQDEKSKKSKTDSKTPKLLDESPTHTTAFSIKIDEIRALQPFVQQSSNGVRIVVIHQADSMTIGASNALLKTLEEPAKNVLIFLISDTPSKLLPTIRSRLQAFKVSDITPEQSLQFMQQQRPDASASDLQQVNQLSAFSPFVALDMLGSQWYQHRQMWLNSWQAVRSFSRTPIQASDFWQKTLTLNDFLFLSQLMLVDTANHLCQISKNQTDIDFDKLQKPPTLEAILYLQNIIEQIWQDRRQHIQDKLCYDKLINAMQMC